MLNHIFISFLIEMRKIFRSKIFLITVAFSIFLCLILALMMILIMNPGALPPGILKTKISLAAVSADWPAYTGMLEMVSGAIGIILFGFASAWIFGREYTDRTVKDLLALPVTRASITASKFIAVAVWCLILSAVIYLLGLVLGFLLNLPLWSPVVLPSFTKIYFFTALLSILLCPPVAYVASAGKGYLPAIGFIMLCMGLANFFANVGLGNYFPWSIPMLYTGAVESANHMPVISYIIIICTFLTGIAGTILQWKYADQNK